MWRRLEPANGLRARRLLPTAAATLLILVQVWAVTEILYRTYLYFDIRSQIAQKSKVPASATFSAYGTEPWLYDPILGFNFNQKPWLVASIKDNAFVRCMTTGKANRYGNVGLRDDGYDDAELKLLLVGSSYSMVPNEKGEVVSDALARQLSDHLGRRVEVLNYSRDATGVLSYVDFARMKGREFKPHAILMLANVTALIYRRHWRQVLPDGQGGRQLYFMLTPNAKPSDRALAFPQQHVINDAITSDWCDRMEAAKARNDTEALRADPVLRTLLAQHERRQREFVTPKQAVDFLRLDVSFVFKALRHRNPFHGIKVFQDQPAYAPLDLDRYAEDPEFVAAVADLKRSGIPVLPIHIPTFPEMLKMPKGGMAFADAGVPPGQGISLRDDLEQQLGERWVHLYSFYSPEARADPLRLVFSAEDSHPSPRGVQAMTDALERVLREHPRTAPLLGLGPPRNESATVSGLGAPVVRTSAGSHNSVAMPGDGRNLIPKSESLNGLFRSSPIASIARPWFSYGHPREFWIAAHGPVGEHYVTSKPLQLAAGPYTLSLEVKPVQSRGLRLQVMTKDGEGVIGDFDFARTSARSGTAGGDAMQSLGARIEKTAAGWYRVSFSADLPAAEMRLIIQLTNADGGRGFAAEGEAILIRGLQLERGRSASPYRAT